MLEILRYLILYEISGGDLFVESTRPLIELMNQSGANPTRASVKIGPGGKSRLLRTSKKKSIDDTLRDIENYNRIALDEPINGNYLNVKSHIRFSLHDKVYYISRTYSDFSIELAYINLKILCTYMTPSYGFVNVEESPDALFHPFGITTSGLDQATWQRIRDLGRSLHTTKEHLHGKIHDVYPMNVLNDAHLERHINGIPLKEWIQLGDRGELRTVKEGVYAWIVPDDQRARIRNVLFKAGALIASV